MAQWRGRLGWIAAATLAMMVIASYTADALGGPLDPPGSPAPTFNALDNVATSWHRLLPAADNGGGCSSSRFDCVMNDEAVLDRETGLVWQRDNSTSPGGFGDWIMYVQHCTSKQAGQRFGWRAPTIEELATLNPTALPTGHPFTIPVGRTSWWSSTTDPVNAANALTVTIGQSLPFSRPKSTVEFSASVWCVRAPGGE